MLTVQPPQRWNGMMAELPSSNELILFGGKSTSASSLNSYMPDFWKFNGTWIYLGGLGTSPGALSNAAMSYDGEYITLVGGETTDGVIAALSKTFSYSTSGGWFQQPLTDTIINTNYYSIPSTIRAASMTYVSGGSQALLLGGITSFYRNYSQDLWSWNGIGSSSSSAGAWTQLSPISNISGRAYAAMASDGTNVLVYGGKNYNGSLSDTQIYTIASNTWTQVSTTTTPGVNAPQALYGSSLVYNAAASNFLLFGGVNLAGQFTNQCWSFSVSSGLWTQITGLLPPPRAYAQMAYLTAASQVVLFGGLGPISDFQDTWQFSSGAWSQLG